MDASKVLVKAGDILAGARAWYSRHPNEKSMYNKKEGERRKRR